MYMTGMSVSVMHKYVPLHSRQGIHQSPDHHMSTCQTVCECVSRLS
jgi:hypothetical protein